jgi:hypothetical protein
MLRDSFDNVGGASGVKHVVMLVCHDIGIAQFHFFCCKYTKEKCLLSRVLCFFWGN